MPTLGAAENCDATSAENNKSFIDLPGPSTVNRCLKKVQKRKIMSEI